MNSDRALKELEALLKEWNMTSLGRRSFLASLPFLMVACAAKKTRYREGDNTGQETQMTVADEQRLTKEVLPEMKKDYPAIQDPWLQNYVNEVGQKILRANQLNGNPYQYNFTLVGVKMVNAFALPAGTIFVTAPILQMADSEAELAGVVGHEIGHVKARHAAERMEAQKRKQKKNIFTAIGGGLLGGAAGFGLGKLLCPPRDNACLARAAALGAAGGVGATLLIQKYAFMANSREDEMESDRIGYRLATAAGYSKDHVGDFYEKLLKIEQQAKAQGGGIGGLADAMSSHPPSRERVIQIEELKSADSRKGGEVSNKKFEEAKSRADKWLKSQPKSAKG